MLLLAIYKAAAPALSQRAGEYEPCLLNSGRKDPGMSESTRFLSTSSCLILLSTFCLQIGNISQSPAIVLSLKQGTCMMIDRLFAKVFSYSLGTRVNMQLLVDTGDIGLYCPVTDTELLGDFLLKQSL
jgi:hypothetical protein